MSTGKKQEGDLAPGTTVGQYSIQRRIGAGGMGEVYEALHAGLNKRVAIKTLRRQFLEHETIAARFLREGQVASRIRHPNVVDVTDVGVIDGLPCLVMEYLEGESLHEMLKRQPVLPVDRLVDIVLPLLGAVEAAHQLGIVHRDLKPANIHLTQSWNGEQIPKVLDFGISKLLHEPAPSSLTTDSTFLGSPHYVSPELARGEKQLDGRSDQYSLGVILYEGACGVRPFAHRADTFMSLMYAIAQGDFEPPRRHRPELPREFEAIVLRAMALRKESRYPSLRELARALLPYASERTRLLLAPGFLGSGVIPAVASEVTLAEGPARLPALAQSQAKGGFEETHGTLGRSASALAAEPRSALRHPMGWIAAGSAAAVAGLVFAWAGLFGFAKLERLAAEPREGEVEAVGAQSYYADVSVEPDTATLTLDGAFIGSGRMRRSFPVGDPAHDLLVSAEGYAPKLIRFDHASPPPARVLLEPLPSEAASGSARAPSAPSRPEPGRSGSPGAKLEPRIEPLKPAAKPPPTDTVDPWDDQ
jgi:tRNA A-37 threonylcarbamoyl transferase component Bud32